MRAGDPQRSTGPDLLSCLSTRSVFAEADLSSYDGVYLGQPFCLKVEGNLLVDIDGLKSAVSKVKSLGKRAYLRTPIIPHTPDFARIDKALEAAVAEGADGVEVHDMGVLGHVRREYPSLNICIGHFANVYHAETARVLAGLGVARVLPSYELTLDEKRGFLPLRDEGLELEVPVGGKIPIGMTHQCLLRLSFPARTEMPCRQQCAERRELDFGSEGWRMRSAGTGMLMAEDLVMIEHLSELVADGYDAVRLETTIESAEKVNVLGRAYRAALDDAVQGRPFDRSNFDAVADAAEGGVCNGWYFGYSGREFVERAEDREVAAALSAAAGSSA